MLGRLPKRPRDDAGAGTPCRIVSGRPSKSAAPLVEMLVDGLRHLRADAAHGGQIGDAGATHRLGRAKMLQQRPFAGRADARYLVKGRYMQRLLAPGAVGADGKAVRLVP